MRNLEKRIAVLEAGGQKNAEGQSKADERDNYDVFLELLGGGGFLDHEPEIIAMSHRIRDGALTDNDRRIFKLIEDEGLPVEGGATTIEVLAEMGRLLETVR